MSTRKGITVVTEAATPHNNYFFSALASDPDILLELHYVFRADQVPGRPWKSLEENLPGVRKVRSGINRLVDVELLVRAIRERRETFFVIGWNHPLFLWLVILRGIARAPLFMWFDTPRPGNGSASARSKSLMKKFIVSMINRTRGTVFVTGKLAAEGLKALGVRADKLVTLPFFVAADRSQRTDPGDVRALKDNHGIPEHTLVVLAAGRLILSKGFDTFIEALHILHKQVDAEWSAILVGSGPEAEALARLAKERGLEQRIRFVPWVESQDFDRLMALCDIFVAPARFDPFPTTIISAMNLGKTVIATDGVGSAVEFIVHDQTGVIVPREQPTALAAALEGVLSSADKRKRMGEKAMEAARSWPVERGVAEIKCALARIADA